MTGAPLPRRALRTSGTGRPPRLGGRGRRLLVPAGALALAALAGACSGSGSGGSASSGPSTVPALVGVQGTSPFTGSALVQEADGVTAARCEEPTAKVVRQDEGAVTEGPLSGASMQWTVCLTGDGTLVGDAGPMQVEAPSGGLTADAATATMTGSPECQAAERASVEGCVQQVDVTFDVTKGTGGWATDTPSSIHLTYVATTANGFGGIVLGQKLRGDITIG